jgi:hypothetical protein
MKIRMILFAVSASCFFSGCSIVMAAHESEPVNLQSLRAGTPRIEVEKLLTNTLSEGGPYSGRVVTYQYYTGHQRSYGRAAAYGLLDIASLGLAEIATTSVEALQGDKHLVTVGYDTSGRLAWLREKIEKAPLDKPERLLGIEASPAAKPASPVPPQPRLPEAERES